jgi:diaminobutyrate-2-oxoglutarate transaminase
MKFSDLHYKPAPKIIVKPPGPKSKKLLEKQLKIEGKAAILYPHQIPLAIESAKGATIKDVDGNTYLDFVAGIGVMNVGSANPIVLEAVQEQQSKMVHALDFPTTNRIKLVTKLREIAPGNLKEKMKITFGGPTGSDAVETAVKCAKYNTKRYGFIAFHGSYHGQTTFTQALSSARYNKKDMIPTVPEVHFLPYPYCYRCVFGQKHPECGLMCLNYLENVLKEQYSGVVKPAAIIVEPVQGEGGIIVPPDNWLSELKKICIENEVLLIIDEIQSGFCRTGKMFASEHSGVTPDIMTMAKAIGGIGYPLSACGYKDELDTGWGHMGTFRGNILAMTAGLKAIEFMQEHKIDQRTATLGKMFLDRLNEIKEKSKHIGDVRGLGLMIGVEFVKEKEGKKPYPEIVNKIRRQCFSQGLLTWSAGHSTVRFLPPLVITEEQIDSGLEIFEDVVHTLEK